MRDSGLAVAVALSGGIDREAIILKQKKAENDQPCLTGPSILPESVLTRPLMINRQAVLKKESVVAMVLLQFSRNFTEFFWKNHELSTIRTR